MNWVISLARATPPSDGQANLFGVVIYTDAHPHVKRMLRDEDYWKALDEVSGPRWVIFATRVLSGEWDLPRLPLGHLGMMHRVWKEPAANRELLDAFELRSTEDLPALVVFAEGADGALWKKVVRLKDDSEKEAYESLRLAVMTVAVALECVEETNLREDARAFFAVRYALKNVEEWEMVKKGLSLWEWLRALV